MNKDFRLFTDLNLKVFLAVFFGFLTIGVAIFLFSIGSGYDRVMFLSAIVVSLFILVLLVRLSVRLLGMDRLKDLDNTLHSALMEFQHRVNGFFNRG